MLKMQRDSGNGPRLEDAIVIGFAASRIARAISIDEISAHWRERIASSAERANGASISDRARRALADLVGCPVCTGWWTSIATSVLWPGRHRIRRGFAVAGVQVLLTFAERLVSEQGRVAVEQADRIAADDDALRRLPHAVNGSSGAR